MRCTLILGDKDSVRNALRELAGVAEDLTLEQAAQRCRLFVGHKPVANSCATIDFAASRAGSEPSREKKDAVVAVIRKEIEAALIAVQLSRMARLVLFG